MKKTVFPTPHDCEAAFYEALEAADLEAMMEVWADDEEVVCIHPGWARLSGFEQIRESWAQIFHSGERLKVRLSDQVCIQGMMLSVHSAHENILVAGETGPRHPVVVTNIYLRTVNGWRMIAHHGSIAPQPARAEHDPPPKILH